MSEEETEQRLYKALQVADSKGWKRVILVDGIEVKVIPVKKALSLLGRRVSQEKGTLPIVLGDLIECEGVVVRREA